MSSSDMKWYRYKAICLNCRWYISSTKMCNHPAFKREERQTEDNFNCVCFSHKPFTDTQKQIKHLIEKESWG